MTIIVRNNRKTKVELVLICNMKRQSDSADFSSEHEINFEDTKENRLYNKMIEVLKIW